MSASADWRSDLRGKMSPSRDVRDVLAQQSGTVLDDMIGDRAVELTWDGSSLALSVDGSPVTDVDDAIVNDGSVVLTFEAYAGRGTLGTTGTMGLQGWVYLDDLGRLRVDLRVPTYAAIFEIDAAGEIAVPPARAQVQVFEYVRDDLHGGRLRWGMALPHRAVEFQMRLLQR
jgi:hypothetical protein